MKIVMKTTNWHEFNADGTTRDPHCPGCWDFHHDESHPTLPYAQCNECGEIRLAKFDGIVQETV